MTIQSDSGGSSPSPAGPDAPTPGQEFAARNARARARGLAMACTNLRAAHRDTAEVLQAVLGDVERGVVPSKEVLIELAVSASSVRMLRRELERVSGLLAGITGASGASRS